MRLGIVRPEGSGLADQIHRDVVASRLQRNDAQIVQRSDMLWLLNQDLLIEVLGLWKPSGLVVLKRDSKSLINRHLRHLRPGSKCQTQILPKSALIRMLSLTRPQEMIGQ